jgi:glutamine synthetase
MIAEMFGSNVFHTEEMARRLTAAQFAEYTGGKLSMETADAVAEAMKNWALERGATHYCH